MNINLTEKAGMQIKGAERHDLPFPLSAADFPFCVVLAVRLGFTSLRFPQWWMVLSAERERPQVQFLGASAVSAKFGVASQGLWGRRGGHGALDTLHSHETSSGLPIPHKLPACSMHGSKELEGRFEIDNITLHYFVHYSVYLRRVEPTLAHKQKIFSVP